MNTIRMSYIVAIVFLSIVGAAGADTRASQDTSIKIAMIRSREIFVGSVGSKMVQVTHDQIAKGLPCWSPDGSKIAFIEKTNSMIALARLNIITPRGSPIATGLIHPAAENTVNIGMRFV